MKKNKLIVLGLMISLLTSCEAETDPYAVPPPQGKLCGVIQSKSYSQDAQGNRTYYIKINGEDRMVSYEIYYSYNYAQGMDVCIGAD